MTKAPRRVGAKSESESAVGAGERSRNRGPASRKQREVTPLLQGSLAPDFVLEDESGVKRRLSDFQGRIVVLYFYPADDTPGCTKEACNFRDDYSAYAHARIDVLGISPDSAESHAKFKAKYNLPFSLLADPGHVVCSNYGVWGEKQFMGRKFEGVLRTTFLIDKNRRIVKVFEKVRPAEHSSEILAELAALT